MSLVLSPTAAHRSTGTRLGLVAGLSAAAIWGAYLALSRAGVAAGLDGLDVAALRYLVAGPVMIAIVLARHDGLRPRMTVGQAISVAVLLGTPFVLLSVGGYAFTPLAHGSVLVPASLTLGGLALSRLVLKEKLGSQRMIGVVIILLGLALIISLEWGLSGTSVVGDAMFILAGLSWATFANLQQRW